MKTFLSFIVKEAKHIVRDRRTMLILIGMPIMMMMLFGFAISTDVRNVRTVVVDTQVDYQTRRITDAIDASDYFTVVSRVKNEAEAELMIRNQEVDLALVFSPRFASELGRGKARVQVVADATDPNMASMYTNYARQIIAASLSGDGHGRAIVDNKMLYNAQMKSAYNFVPGIMGMLLMIICAMMTSISIVREKEQGTMELLLVSPAHPIMIIIAKAIPYLLLSLIVCIIILIMSSTMLDVPIRSGLVWIFLVSLLYIFLSLSIGLLISVVAQTQVTAMLVSGMVLLIPCIMLSGMLFPIESMPSILQSISVIVPARWYISAMRKLMIMGVEIRFVVKEILMLLSLTTFFLIVSIVKFKNRLE